MTFRQDRYITSQAILATFTTSRGRRFHVVPMEEVRPDQRRFMFARGTSVTDMVSTIEELGYSRLHVMTPDNFPGSDFTMAVVEAE